MGWHQLVITVVTLALTFPLHLRGESIDGRVVQVSLPVDDIELAYIETKGGMAIELSTGSTSVIGTRFYVGDGKVAVELVAHSMQGIFFQGQTKLEHGYTFKKYSVVDVRPGFKRAADLAPGDVYVIFPAVTFRLKGLTRNP